MKNKIKRIVTIVIALAVLLTAANPTATEAAAKKPTLNKTKISLMRTNKKSASTTTLKVKDAKKAAKWTSSNKKVVTIKEKDKHSIKIIAKKDGKTTITCKVDGKTLKCKVTVVDEDFLDFENGDWPVDNAIGAVVCTFGAENDTRCMKFEFTADDGECNINVAFERLYNHQWLHMAFGHKKEEMTHRVVYYKK